MNSDTMNVDLVDEIEYMIESLTKSGFFNHDEILEILEDQFIEEDVDFSQFTISLNNYNNFNFKKLESVFNALVSENIVGVHNCGFDIEEGVADVFELYVHLKNNKFSPEGFCFYTFEDVEDAIYDNKLKITFGDFENNEEKALDCGKKIYNALSKEFDLIWDETINTQIEINPITWDKSYTDNEYEIEGAYEVYTKNGC